MASVFRSAQPYLRLLFGSAVGVVPEHTRHAVRDTYISSEGLKRRALKPLASALRHAPFGAIDDFDLPDHPGVRLVAVESRIARLLYWFGDAGFEPGEADWWQRLCAAATSIVELGGNIGYYTVVGAAAARDTPYRVVEANPESAAILQRNVELNRLENVTVINAAAVGDPSIDEVELALPDLEWKYAAPAGAYLVQGGEGVLERPASRTVTVPARPAAELIAGADLLKLDIEGYEATVLEAAWPVIMEERPIIVTEVLPHVPRLRAQIRALHASGYLAFAVGADSLHLLEAAQLASEEPLPRYGNRDVLLVPAERIAAL